MLKKLINKIYLGVFFILTVVSSYAMSIGPIYFNQRIDGSGGYQEYEIDNPSFSTKRYKIQVTPENNNKELKKKMEKWVEVYPKVLTIPPKSTGKVKVLIKSSPNTKPGEYSFILAPTPITIPTLENKKGDSKLATIGIQAPLHFFMALNGYVGSLGDIYKDVKIEKLKSNDGLKIKITNDMKREVALDILVTDNKTRYRDLLKIKVGKTMEKKYKNGKKLEIKEAPTGMEIKTFY
ncbi:MAG: hypothetical protein ACRDDH_16915 [Cetobacterium sp.]|uniref:hypothetical protein n=1 Tax=Cetobacterium sp. TaxID=2071632 RepID=UPI003EE4D177